MPSAPLQAAQSGRAKFSSVVYYHGKKPVGDDYPSDNIISPDLTAQGNCVIELKSEVAGVG
jgi:hypothetical protein